MESILAIIVSLRENGRNLFVLIVAILVILLINAIRSMVIDLASHLKVSLILILRKGVKIGGPISGLLVIQRPLLLKQMYLLILLVLPLHL